MAAAGGAKIQFRPPHDEPRTKSLKKKIALIISVRIADLTACGDATSRASWFERFEGTLSKSGDYKIRVYLLRSAARRREVAALASWDR